MKTYYIDMQNGQSDADGLSPERARSSYTDLPIQPGDTVLFRRGNRIRATLERVAGIPDAPVTYGAYGEGDAPMFIGSADVSDAADWESVGQNIWKYKKHLESEACNFIYDNGRIGGTLRWRAQDLCKQGDWFDSRMGTHEQHSTAEEEKVLLYSVGNPGTVYSHIECAVFGKRNLSANRDNTVVEDLAFYGSGVHALSGGAKNMTVRRCSFGFIGGAVWNRQLRIRFGNAIEFWNIGENIRIEDCYFNNIYDSCITQQGSRGECRPATDLIMCGNLFVNYGMGAYEGRDLMPVRCAFENNVCIGAGGGFSAFGDTKPRNSEIYPQPMGHHIFMWRITEPSDGGSFRIRNNSFTEATGSALYAIIDAEADKQMTVSDNTYTATDTPHLNVRAWKWYSGEEYRAYGERGMSYEKRDTETLCRQWLATHTVSAMGMPVLTDTLPEQVWFNGTTEKNPLSYHVGEVIRFSLNLVKGGKPFVCPYFYYTVNGDDGTNAEGYRVGTDGTIAVETVLTKPGYVRLTVVPCDENKTPISGYDTFDGGACADFDKIRENTKEPADFDAYWKRVLTEELDHVKPELLEKSEFHCGDPGDVVYDVKIACAGGMPVSGYLRMPRNAENGSLPISVTYHGYGVSTADIPKKATALQLDINPHGIENGKPDLYYQQLERGVLAGFGFSHNETPDTVYFKYMVLRAIQAIRYMMTLPQWDGKNIIVNGGSMGAFQSVCAAALCPSVTKLNITIPWLCDLRGVEIGRMRGWRPDAADGLDYFDTVTMAKRVTAQTTMLAGLGDYVCPPSGETALYHAFRCPVECHMLQNKTHPYTAPVYSETVLKK